MALSRRAFAVEAARGVWTRLGWQSTWSLCWLADELMLALRAEERAGRVVWRDGEYYDR